MHVRGITTTRNRSFARCGAVVAAVATALSAAGPAVARDLETADGVTVRPAVTVPAQPATPATDVVARYAFEWGSRTVVDLSGNGHTLRVRTGRGGRVRAVQHGQGRAVAFPRKCASKPCARVVLQAAHTAELNPGRRPFSFGAAVKLARSQTSKGQNVVQKGYSARTSQYKLQIDGAAGKPSCVLVDRRSTRIRLVKSSVTVADNAWHSVECRRVGALFSIWVDGVARGAITVPVGLSVVNTAPLSLGGKGGSQNNDQFRGALDDVWISVG